MTRFSTTALLTAALLAGAGGLAACGERAAEPAPVEAQPVETPPVTAPWSLTSTAEGAVLRLEADGAAVFDIACRRGEAGNSGRLEASAAALTPIASEDRFTLGAGDEAFALAADLEAERASGVEASGAIPADLIDRVARGEALSVHYGAQTVGPLAAVPDAERSAFVAACREIGSLRG